MSAPSGHPQSTEIQERPGPLRRIGYLLGRPLPESMRAWVRNDVTGPGHLRRYVVRGFLPVVPILIALFFIPGSLMVRLGMVLLLAIPLIYFQIALSGVYRRHLLRNNGLDPALAEKHKVIRIEEAQAAYLAQHRSPTLDDGATIDGATIDGTTIDARVIEPGRSPE